MLCIQITASFGSFPTIRIKVRQVISRASKTFSMSLTEPDLTNIETSSKICIMTATRNFLVVLNEVVIFSIPFDIRITRSDLAKPNIHKSDCSSLRIEKDNLQS